MTAEQCAKIAGYKERLAHSLQSSRLFLSDSRDEKRRIISSLVCPFVPPLYQYRKCNEGSIASLSTGTFLLQDPRKFNDVFDCLIHFDSEKYEQEMCSFTPKDARRIIERLRCGEIPENEEVHYGGKEVVMFYRMLSTFSDAVLEKGYYSCFSKFQHVSREFVGRCLYTMQGLSRISCFSEDPVSPIMWGHYGDAGKGFCVRYDFQPLLGLSKCRRSGRECCVERCEGMDHGICGEFSSWSLFPVLYTTSRYDLTYLVEDEVRNLIRRGCGCPDITPQDYDLLRYYKIALFKSIDWSYEKEWRIIMTADGLLAHECLSSPSLFQTEVLLGPLISKGNENAIRKAVANYEMKDGRGVRVRKVSADYFGKGYAFHVME